MYAGMTVYALRPGKKVEATRIWNESFLPVVSKQKGFKGALWLIAPEVDKAIGIELWDMDVAASAFENNGTFQVLAAKFQPVLTGAVEREQYQTTLTGVSDLPGLEQQSKPKAAGAGLRLRDD